MTLVARVSFAIVTSLFVAVLLGGSSGDAAGQFARATPRGKAACSSQDGFSTCRVASADNVRRNYRRSVIPGIGLPTACVLPARTVYQRATRGARPNRHRVPYRAVLGPCRILLFLPAGLRPLDVAGH